MIGGQTSLDSRQTTNQKLSQIAKDATFDSCAAIVKRVVVDKEVWLDHLGEGPKWGGYGYKETCEDMGRLTAWAESRISGERTEDLRVPTATHRGQGASIATLPDNVCERVKAVVAARLEALLDSADESSQDAASHANLNPLDMIKAPASIAKDFVLQATQELLTDGTSYTVAKHFRMDEMSPDLFEAVWSWKDGHQSWYDSNRWDGTSKTNKPFPEQWKDAYAYGSCVVQR